MNIRIELVSHDLGRGDEVTGLREILQGVDESVAVESATEYHMWGPGISRILPHASVFQQASPATHVVTHATTSRCWVMESWSFSVSRRAASAKSVPFEAKIMPLDEFTIMPSPRLFLPA